MKRMYVNQNIENTYFQKNRKMCHLEPYCMYKLNTELSQIVIQKTVKSSL